MWITHESILTRLSQTPQHRHGISFHKLRHGHATLLLEQNMHPKVVQERLGHSSIAITLDLYSHVLPGLQEVAVKKFETLVTEAVE